MKNRRDHFRIQGTAHVKYWTGDTGSLSPADEGGKFGAYLELMNELSILDLESNRLIAELGDNERMAASLYKITNRKIESIARTLVITESVIPENEIQTINISEGGMAFHSEKPLPEGQSLLLRMVLLPTFFSVLTKAIVVANQKQREIAAPDNLPFWTRVNFVNLDDRQQQLLAKQILKFQQQQRRKAAL